jgi:hypothetical protein
MPLRTGIDVATNQDYFGDDIYESGEETAGSLAAKLGVYTLSQNSHPFVKAMIKGMSGETADAVFEALELPISVYPKDKVISASIYSSAEDTMKKAGLTSLDPNEVRAAAESGSIKGETPQSPLITKLVGRLYDDSGKEDETVPESQRKFIREYLASVGVEPKRKFAENKVTKKRQNLQERKDVAGLSKEEKTLYEASKSSRKVMLKDMGKKMTDFPKLMEMLKKYGEEREPSNYNDQMMALLEQMTKQDY